MSTKKREVIFGGRIMGAKIRAEHARELAKKAQRDADRAEAEPVVDQDGSLWRPSAAVADHCSMPQRQARMA
jgi:hypothetical protein